jgi:dihydrolipoamide dehydrogenase
LASSEQNRTELAVIGAGPGGYAAAFLAADLGMKTTLIDPEANPGGVCLYRGCIPSKALLHAAKLLTDADEAKEMGIDFGEPEVDVEKLRGWKDDVVKKLTGGLGQLGKQRKVSYVRGRGSFVDGKTLEIEKEGGGKSRLSFEHAVLATGSEPASLPGLGNGGERILDSSTALELRDVPKSLLVVGGGYIGLELGTVYAALGSRVTVVEMMPGLLPGVDRDLVKVLQKRVEKRFESVLLETKVAELKESSRGVKVRFDGEGADGEERTFEKVLVSVGRRPRSANLGLENTSVELDDRGFVKVDAQRRTAEPTIFAIGDVAGEPMLAHKATHEGRLAVEAAGGKKVAFEPHAIPAVVFTDPEVAWCGLSETEAKKKDRKVAVARFPWAASGRALTLGRADGLTKLVLDPETERVLGVGIVGAGAGELIAEGVVAVEMAAVAEDLELCIHPHPTLSETIMQSAEVYFGRATDLYRPRRSS